MRIEAKKVEGLLSSVGEGKKSLGLTFQVGIAGS